MAAAFPKVRVRAIDDKTPSFFEEEAWAFCLFRLGPALKSLWRRAVILPTINGMKVIRHARYADKIMRIEGALAVTGVGGGMLLWCEASRFGGYGFAAAAFLALGGVNAGVKAMRNYNRFLRGAEGEDAVVQTLHALPEGYACISNFVVPGTRQGDADLLVIGPFGVLVVEVKTYIGLYACHGDAWFRIHEDGARQPLRSSISKQLKRNRKSVQHYLVDCDIETPVHGVVVFPEAMKLDCAHPTVPVVRLPGLLHYVLQLPTAASTMNVAHLAQLFSPSLPISCRDDGTTETPSSVSKVKGAQS